MDNYDDQVNALSESRTKVLWYVGRDTCPLWVVLVIMSFAPPETTTSTTTTTIMMIKSILCPNRTRKCWNMLEKILAFSEFVELLSWTAYNTIYTCNYIRLMITMMIKSSPNRSCYKSFCENVGKDTCPLWVAARKFQLPLMSFKFPSFLF